MEIIDFSRTEVNTKIFMIYKKSVAIRTDFLVSVEPITSTQLLLQPLSISLQRI